jgi:hypothetical protein
LEIKEVDGLKFFTISASANSASMLLEYRPTSFGFRAWAMSLCKLTAKIDKPESMIPNKRCIIETVSDRD